MSYFFSNSPLVFGIKLWQVIKGTITRTQAKLEQSVERKTVPCSLIAAKSDPVNQTSFICASNYQVRSLSCAPLAAPFAFERCLLVTIDEAGCKELSKVELRSNEEKESSSIDNLLALDSLYATSSKEPAEEVNSELIEVHPEPKLPSPKPNCASSSFLAFLEASNLKMSERFLSQQSQSTTVDLGCAQFNSAYYRRHPPPSLPQLKVKLPSKKSFCWKSKMDEIMRESGEECDDIVEESDNEFNQGFPSSSSSHTRSSSFSSDITCVESPELLVISSVKELEVEISSTILTLPAAISQPIVDVKPILPSPPAISPCTPSSFLAFLESSNLTMITRMQAEKLKHSTLDLGLGCAQFNSTYYRRHPPPSLPRLKEVQSLKEPFCWKTRLDQMINDEECADVSKKIVNDMSIQPNVFFPSSTHTSSPRVRSLSCSSNVTCVEETPILTPFSKIVSLTSPLELPLSSVS